MVNTTTSTTDLAKDFDQKDFDLKKWINLRFAGHKSIPLAQDDGLDPDFNDNFSPPSATANTPATPLPAEPKLLGSAFDQQTSSLLVQLQFLNQDISQKLDNHVQEAQRSMPRVLHDLHVLGSALASLDAELDAIRAESDAPARSSTHTAFAALEKLDHVRARMESTRNSLREAESWSSLASEMEALFASKAYDAAATKLAEAERSLVLLQQTTDYDDKKALLHSLQDQLDTALKPQAVRVLSEYDASGARPCLDLFELIHRRSKFLDIYFSIRTSPLLRLWTQYDEDVAAGRAGDLPTWIEGFYGEVSLLVTKELAWTPAVFRGDARAVVQSLVQKLFSTVDPPMSSRLSAAAANPLESLQVLISAYQATLSFGSQLENTLASSPSMAVASSPQTSSSEWLYILYEPFVPFQQDYAHYEKQSLLVQLQTLTPVSLSDPIDLTGSLAEEFPWVFSAAEGAIARCNNFTFGLASPGLLSTLSDFFLEVHSRYTNAIVTLRQLLNLEEIGHEQSYDDHSLSADLAWTNFQPALKFLAIAAAMFQRLESFESRLSAQLLSNPISSPQSTPQSLLHLSALNSYAYRTLLSSTPNPLLPRVHEASKALTRGAQRLLYDTMFRPIYLRLHLLPTPPPPTPHPFNLELPQFSLSPQPYITRIGEHLLTLPQHLDMYSDDHAALAFSISTIPHCSVRNTDTVDDDEDIPHIWIEALARGTMDQYIASIGALPGFPPHAARQLAADIGYLCNVLAAMDVEPLSGLLSVRRVLEAEQSEDLAGALEDEEIVRRIAALRMQDA
ncbi:oligomeric Golgi complex subunit 7 [Cladochytrium replicatum]|nr:oligomeric Golgi complex subunit 7 [Cladochytrium replicatum]